MRDQRSQGDIWDISWCKHSGTNDGKLLPIGPHDKKKKYPTRLDFKRDLEYNLLATDYQNYDVPKLEKIYLNNKI